MNNPPTDRIEEACREFEKLSPSACINADKETGEIVWVPAMADFLRSKLKEYGDFREQEGKDKAVDFIKNHFNDEEYAKMWGEESEDWTDDEHSAAFLMWFTPLLESARTTT